VTDERATPGPTSVSPDVRVRPSIVNVTVPVGFGVEFGTVTVAVRVTVSPRAAGLGVWVNEVVLAAALTMTVKAPLLPTKQGLPEYVAVPWYDPGGRPAGTVYDTELPENEMGPDDCPFTTNVTVPSGGGTGPGAWVAMLAVTGTGLPNAAGGGFGTAVVEPARLIWIGDAAVPLEALKLPSPEYDAPAVYDPGVRPGTSRTTVLPVTGREPTGEPLRVNVTVPPGGTGAPGPALDVMVAVSRMVVP
jgi:hypothetical protein